MTNDERPSHQTTRSSSSVSTSLRAEEKKRGLTPAEKALIEQVCFAWAEHQGWPKGRWPRSRRYDAVLITLWVRKLGGSIDRWKLAITRVPRDAAFTALTTPPAPGRIPLLEEILVDTAGREAAWASEKKQHAEDSKTIGDVLRRMVGAPPNA